MRTPSPRGFTLAAKDLRSRNGQGVPPHVRGSRSPGPDCSRRWLEDIEPRSPSIVGGGYGEIDRCAIRRLNCRLRQSRGPRARSPARTTRAPHPGTVTTPDGGLTLGALYKQRLEVEPHSSAGEPKPEVHPVA